MLFRDVIELVSFTYTENGLGDMLPVKDTRQVFANKKSIRQTEFYQAAAVGLQPELMFEVRSVDYQGEKKLEHEGREYHIIRTYDKNGETTELICTGLVNQS